jgi:tetratricopeptide (TPR) repeat protein
MHRRLVPVAQVIGVGALDAAAVSELARRAGVADQAERIMARTGGHTLFVVESLRALTAGDTGVPESLREAVLQRVSRAGAQNEEVLRAAAVVGTSFEPGVVGGVLGLDAVEAARRCEQLLPTRLVVVAGRAYEFAHDLVHEVLYESTPEPTRLSYHHLAADLLSYRPEAVGSHAAATGDWGRAARAWMLAAEQAAARYASADAERLLERSLDAAHRVPDRNLCARALAARGLVRERAGRYRDAERDLREALRLADETADRHLEMRVMRLLGGDVIVALGYPIGECEQLLGDALAISVELGDHAAEIDLLSRLAVVALNQLRFDASSEHAAHALRIARAGDDEWGLILALDGEKSTLAYLGDVAELAPRVERLGPMLRRHGELFLLQWTVFESSFIPFAHSDWPAASARVEEALELNRRSGHVAYSGWMQAHLGWIERLQGNYDAAIELGRRSVAGTSPLPYAWWNTFSHAMLATTLAETGAVDEAIGLLTEGLRLADRGGTPAYRLRCLALLAQLTGSAEVLAEAEAVLAGVSAPPGRAWLHGIDAYVAIANAHLDHGDVGAALAVIGPVAAAARSCGHELALAQSDAVTLRAESLRAGRPTAQPRVRPRP